jgi:hypothetical protein
MKPPTRGLILAAAVLGLIASALRAQESQLEVDVRPKIMDKEAMWAHKTPFGTGGHSKIYGIYSVQLVKSDQKLVKPVDDTAILQLVSEELNKNGFRLYAPGTKPEILLTVSYGRGEMHNPYFRDEGEVGGDYRAGAAGGFANDSGATTHVVNGAFPLQLYDEKTPGWEAKLQKAGGEKLFIRVTAFEYPKDPKAKPKMLWKTVIVVDDPDHRDLNKIAAAMLAAGVPYFDKEIREPEATVYKPIPDGRVNVGAPEVVPSKAK